MAITYDSDNNYIRVKDEGSSDDPCTFEDIYNADQDGSWDKFHKVADKVYNTEAKIVWDACVFKDSYCSLSSEKLTTKNGDWFYQINNDNSDVTFVGVNWFLNEPDYNDCYFLISKGDSSFTSCTFINNDSSKRIKLRGTPNSLLIQECKMDFFVSGIKAHIIDTLITGKNGQMADPDDDCVFENLMVDTGNAYAIWFAKDNLKINGGKFNGSSMLAKMHNADSLELSNAILDKTKIQVAGDDGTTTDFTVSYDINFKIYDEDNELISKKVKITDKDGNKVFDSDVKDDTVNLKKWFIHIENDGDYHYYNVDDYTKYLPYTVEIYDDEMTYYIYQITDLKVANSVQELSIVKPTRNIFTEIDNLISKVENKGTDIQNNLSSMIGDVSDKVADIPTNPLLTDDNRLDNLDEKISSKATQDSINDISSKLDVGLLPSWETDFDEKQIIYYNGDDVIAKFQCYDKDGNKSLKEVRKMEKVE